MNLRISYYILLALIITACRHKEEVSTYSADTEYSPYVIEVSELQKDLGKSGIKVVDFRLKEEYDRGHIPGALNIWRSDLQNPDYPYKGMLVKKEDLENLLGSLGINNEDLLVIYDDKGSVDACRLWWTLQYYYFDSVRILNGGLSTWRAAGGAVSKEKARPTPTNFTLPDSTRNDILIRKSQLAEVVREQQNVKILDVRSSDEYSGSLQRPGAFKAGRIPGSMHVEWSMAIDTNRRFKSREELVEMYNKLGLRNTDSIVVYCHSGSRSAHTNFVLEKILNFETVMNYDGSWTEWSYYEELPYEKDSLILEVH